MKDGDKLLCKKQYSKIVNKTKVQLNEGEYYMVKYILKNIIQLENDLYFQHVDPESKKYIWEYFFSIKEERKIKLNNINDK